MESTGNNDSCDLKTFLRGALPEWRVSQLMMAEKKLKTVGIETVSRLLHILKLSGADSLNDSLRRHGEREFSAETIDALKSRTISSSGAIARVSSSSSLEKQDGLMERRQVVPSLGGEQKGRGPSLKERFLAAKAQKASSFPTDDARSSLFTTGHPDPVAAAVAAKKARAELEEELEIMTGQLEEAQERGDSEARAAREADVDRLSVRLETLATNVARDWSIRSTAVTQASEVSAWFEVIFSKVFVKKFPSDKATTWGWVLRGQAVEVLPTRAVDEDGREWIELTLFELWRSCMCDPPLKYEDNRNARGYCLVDAASEGLGILMRGPIAKSSWPALDPNQVARFHDWCGISNRPTRNSPRMVASAAQQVTSSPSGGDHYRAQLKPLGKGVQEFEVAHAGMQIYERASLFSNVLGEKTRGERIQCDLGSASTGGFVRLLGERGWVLAWMLRPKIEQVGQNHESSRERAPVRYSMAKTPDLGLGLIADVRESLRLIVASVIDDADLDHDFADSSSRQRGPHLIYQLEAAIERAKACCVDEGIVEAAERHLEALSREGEPNRRKRLLRARLAKSITGNEAIEVAKRADCFGYADVSEEARSASARLDDVHAQTKDIHASSLRRLCSAVALGDEVEIKAARDAAKSAGVPKRELARVFALAQP